MHPEKHVHAAASKSDWSLHGLDGHKVTLFISDAMNMIVPE